MSPMRNTGPAVPWSVPCDALACTRRPNSEYAITTTSFSRADPVSAVRNAVIALSTWVSWEVWAIFSSACVSNPEADTA